MATIDASRAESRTALNSTQCRSLASIFLLAAQQHLDRTALVIGDARYSYKILLSEACAIRKLLADTSTAAESRLGAVFGNRGFMNYAGILGTLLSGAGYVPLNLKFPDERNALIMNVSGAATLTVEDSCVSRLGFLRAVNHSVLVVVPHGTNTDELRNQYVGHKFVELPPSMAACDESDWSLASGNEVAYVFFTSGSTGVPKGVVVTNRNVVHHLDSIWSRYQIDSSDRCSQTFDLSFDLSVFDIFATLGRGAELHILGPREQKAPDRFIRDHQLSVWFSVPAVGMMLRSFKLLQPGIFPSLRLALFCGERLPSAVAQAWQAAAPNAILENLYGPTEVTIACTRYRWNPVTSPAECIDGGVPIGVPFEGMTAAVVDEELRLVPTGVRGELCMAGPQVAKGYASDAVRTGERFVSMAWDASGSNRWYRTGDMVTMREDGNLIHLGRNDDQVKVQGFRIELGEVEFALREIAESDFVVALTRDKETGIQLVAIFAHTKLTGREILERAKGKMPAYMIPHQMVFLDELPTNASGKLDRKALAALLHERDAKN